MLEIQAYAQSLIKSELDCVFLGGSRAEGWANKRSDYDLYVITNAADIPKGAGEFWLHTEQAVGINYYLFEGQNAEVQYWPVDVVRSAVSFLNAYRFKGFSELPHRYVDFIHRLLNGWPLCNAQAFEDLRNSIEPDAFKYYRAITEERLFEAYLNDASAFAEDDSVSEALIASRMCLEASIDCYLSLRGETNPGSKWRPKKLAKISNSALLLSRYLNQLAGPGSTNPGEALAFSRQTCLLADEVNIASQLGSDYDDLFGTLREESIDGRRFYRRSDVRLRSSLRGTIELVSHNGLRNQISTGAAIIWAHCSGRGEETIASALVRLAGLAPDTALRDTRTGIAALAKHKLLHIE